jgi:tyrosinase
MKEMALTPTIALTPFHMNAAGDFYTPATAKDITKLGYTYPELVNNPSNATLIAMLKNNYSGPETGGSPKMKRQEQNSNSQAYLAEAELPATGNPYSLYIFLGDVTGEAADYTGLESFVGLASTLGTHADLTLHQMVDVTATVEEKIEAGETTAEGAVDYLKGNLKWRLVFVSFFFFLKLYDCVADKMSSPMPRSPRTRFLKRRFRLFPLKFRKRNRFLNLINGSVI